MQNTLFNESKFGTLRPLRPRQAAAIEQIRQAVREKHTRIILQAPPGMGKTLIAAHLIHGSVEKGKRPIFTCPAITLVEQTLEAFEFEGIRDIGVIQAQHERTDWTRQVQIASVQTLVRRALPEVDVILIDECHESFEELNKRLDSAEWAGKIAIGLSATPWAKGMGLRWTKLIVAATTNELIAEGYLSSSCVFVPEYSVDRSRLKSKMGEFTDASSSEAMRSPKIVGDVVKEWKERGPGEKTFMFCVDRNHAKSQMEAFQDAGIPFGYIDALTPMDDRTRQFQKMGYGELAGIASVGCLIRGVDEDVRAIIDAQPTKSVMRHVQKWGRGIRMADGKEFLIGLDHAGNNQSLGLFADIHFDRLDTSKPGEKGNALVEEKKPSKPKTCPLCKALIPPNQRQCPACGAMVSFTSVEAVAGDLVQLGEGGKAQNKANREATLFEKQEFYSGLLTLAHQRGKSEGSAAHRYREKYGKWPNALEKIQGPVSLEVQNWDRHCRIRYAKSKAKEAVSA